MVCPILARAQGIQADLVFGLLKGNSSGPCVAVSSKEVVNEAVIKELERERLTGVRFIVLGSPAFWWLDYYSGFAVISIRNFDCVLQNDRLEVLDLR